MHVLEFQLGEEKITLHRLYRNVLTQLEGRHEFHVRELPAPRVAPDHRPGIGRPGERVPDEPVPSQNRAGLLVLGSEIDWGDQAQG